MVRLDRNQRQSRAEKRLLGRNAACPTGNAQLRGGYGEGSYEGREEQIIWRAENPSKRYRGGGPSMPNWEGGQIGLERDPNAMDVDRGRGGDRMYYVCEKWDHIAKNC